MSNVLKNSQYGFAISKLAPNQVMLIAENPTFSIYDESAVEEVVVLTMANGGPLTLNYEMNNFGNLKTVVLSERTEEIGPEVFAEQGMTVIDGTVNVKTIGAAAFAGCPNLESIDLPNVETIAEQAFASCALLKKVRIPKIKNIGVASFSEVAYLKDIDLSNVETISEQAFANCGLLEEINLPKVKHIGQYTFVNDTNAVITLNDDVETVDDNAFLGVAHLYYHGNLPRAPWGATAWN